MARGAAQGRFIRLYLPIPVVQLSDELKLRKGEAAFTQTITKVLLEITLWKERPCSFSPNFRAWCWALFSVAPTGPGTTCDPPLPGPGTLSL